MPAESPELAPGQWPLSQAERNRLAMIHEEKSPPASRSEDGFRLATCVCCERPMVAMWHLWVNIEKTAVNSLGEKSFWRMVKEIHMCHACATDIYGAPTPDQIPVIPTGVIQHGDG